MIKRIRLSNIFCSHKELEALKLQMQKQQDEVIKNNQLTTKASVAAVAKEETVATTTEQPETKPEVAVAKEVLTKEIEQEVEDALD